MKCIILAAGYATRLYPLTENFPKPLLPVGEKTILDWLVDDLSAVIDEFVVISNHKFFCHFQDWAKKKKENVTILDDGTETNETRLGAVRDIQFAVKRLSIQEDCVVMAGDNVLDFSLQPFIRFSEEKNTSCVMCHKETRLEALRKTAVINFDGNGLILDYEEKPLQPKGSYAVPPFYFYKADDLSRIDEALAEGCGCDAPGSFAAWLSAKVPVHAYIMPGKRYDIGDMESYRHIRETYMGILQTRFL